MGDPKVILFDLDGTLANCDHRKHFIEGETKDWRAFFAACFDDTPVQEVVAVLFALDMVARSVAPRGQAPAEIWIVSGRSDEVRLKTEMWLAHHQIPCARLFMRDEGDHRPDEVVKRELMEPHLHRVTLVFDDRSKVVKMWRSLGLTCFQVAEGDF